MSHRHRAHVNKVGRASHCISDGRLLLQLHEFQRRTIRVTNIHKHRLDLLFLVTEPSIVLKTSHITTCDHTDAAPHHHTSPTNDSPGSVTYPSAPPDERGLCPGTTLMQASTGMQSTGSESNSYP